MIYSVIVPIYKVEKYLEKCISLEEQGFLKRNGEAYILTRKGIMLANDVLDEFI